MGSYSKLCRISGKSLVYLVLLCFSLLVKVWEWPGFEAETLAQLSYFCFGFLLQEYVSPLHHDSLSISRFTDYQVIFFICYL